MLSYLRIQNFALLDDVEVAFEEGMTVLTGETGAGKSMILSAVSLLSGGRANADLVREGAQEARIEAIFRVHAGSLAESALKTRLEEAGLVVPLLEEEGLFVKRIIGKKSRASIADQLVSASVLASVCEGLIDVSSQHEHQTLMQVSRHLSILDESGISRQLLAAMKEAFDRLESASKELAAISTADEQRTQREEFLQFQLQEFEKIKPLPGEDEQLKKERGILRAAEKLLHGVSRAEEALYSREGAIIQELAAYCRDLQELAKIDATLEPAAHQLQEAQVILEETARFFRHYADQMNIQPQRLDEIEQRLDALLKLLRKHGPDIEMALQKEKQLRDELDTFADYEQRRQEAAMKVELARHQAKEIATQLSEERSRMAHRLQHQMNAELEQLALKGATLVPVIEPRVPREGDSVDFIFPDPTLGPRRVTAQGFDRCEFLFSPTATEELRPLARIASGGELSRILLALKRVLGRADGVPTYVFDEIDSGIGGLTASRVGAQIKALSNEKQVLCITHLASIACYADHHLVVEKTVDSKRTSVSVKEVTGASLESEIARMLGGPKITEKTREYARELLKSATP